MARRDFSDWLDEQPIPWWRRIFVRLHLRICPRCIRVQRSLVATKEALAALKDGNVE
jgi:hypothetical protein